MEISHSIVTGLQMLLAHEEGEYTWYTAEKWSFLPRESPFQFQVTTAYFIYAVFSVYVAVQ